MTEAHPAHATGAASRADEGVTAALGGSSARENADRNGPNGAQVRMIKGDKK